MSSGLQAGQPPVPVLSAAALFGDGSDGDVVIAVNTSLSRDMYYNNLTVNAGVTLNPKGWRIFVKGKLTVEGKIASNGANGASPGAGGVGALYDTKNLKVGNASLFIVGIGTGGGNGGNGAAGVAGGSFKRDDASEVEYAQGSVGGAGGAGASGAGGAAGALNAGGTMPLLRLRSVAELQTLPDGGIFLIQTALGTLAWTSYNGGTGGGGGGGSAGKSGGGGGGGGGLVLVFAYEIGGAGSIEAKAGDGGNGDAAGNTGGGGGGGGGFVGLVYHASSGAWTSSVAGGAKGLKAGTGVDGSDGNAGNLVSFQV